MLAAGVLMMSGMAMTSSQNQIQNVTWMFLVHWFCPDFCGFDRIGLG